MLPVVYEEPTTPAQLHGRQTRILRAASLLRPLLQDLPARPQCSRSRSRPRSLRRQLLRVLLRRRGLLVAARTRRAPARLRIQIPYL